MPRDLDRGEMERVFEEVKNWGRWGAEDQRGALNYITDAKRAAAAALVRDGEAVSCALDLPVQPGPENPHPALHMMLVAGDACTGEEFGGLEATTDFIGLAFHGMASSHVDALCHVLVGGRMYNGFEASDVKSTGARRGSIMAASDGIATRGVLIDVARLRGVEFLEPSDRIGVEDLEAAEKAQDLRVEEGDALLVHTGRHTRRERVGAWDVVGEGMAGLHPETVRWLHERRIGVLGSDGIQDPLPQSGIPGWPVPIHQCGIAAMGLHLLDNLDLRGVAAACGARRRFEFFLVVAPLRVPGGTGSPVNPIAIF